jgi:phage terminase large subunit
MANRLAYSRSPDSPDKIRLELAFCAQNPIHWINRWCWTFDPRELGRANQPFDLWPRQEQYLQWLQAREAAQNDGLCEKSRDMGITWLSCAFALHGWLFREGYKVGFGSRKLEYVDEKGNMDSIMEKARYLYRNLPEWMLPEGFSPKEHDHYCKLINPKNGSAITGEGGDEIGRGGRASIYFIDEAASLERPELAEASLSQTTRVRIYLSTPKGSGNVFYRKRFSLPAEQVFTFHWKDDPRKNDAWYESEKARIGDDSIVAQELNIDYSGSLAGICIPAEWVRAAVNLKLPCRRQRKRSPALTWPPRAATCAS